MEEREITDSAAVVRFYDAVRSSMLSAAALAHGEASIGQECLLAPDEIADLARQAGGTAGTSVLEGSRTFADEPAIGDHRRAGTAHLYRGETHRWLPRLDVQRALLA
jgi:hypothetical protein